MAIHQTKRQSDLEKRLKLLRLQVYGKGSQSRETQITRQSEDQKNQIVRESEKLTLRYSETPISSDTPTRSESIRSDVAYLRYDLMKISLFASIAFGLQAVLFYLLQNHILRLKIL